MMPKDPPSGRVELNPKETIAHYNESSIAALHQARSERLYGTADAGTDRPRGLGFRTLLARARQALGTAPSPQPVHNG